MRTIVPRHIFDAAYIERLANGDADTELHFTTYFTDLLRAKLCSRLREGHLRDDVCQETFFRVLRTIRQKGGPDQPGALGAFVNAVCNNILLEVYRSQAKTVDTMEDRAASESNAEEAIADQEEKDEVRRVLSAMPQKDQRILIWLFFDEMDKDEVCRRLSVDREYLRVLVHRAKLRFRSDFLVRQKPRAATAGAQGSGNPRGVV